MFSRVITKDVIRLSTNKQMIGHTTPQGLATFGHSTREYSSGFEKATVFDRDLKRKHRDAAATAEDYQDFQYIRKEVASRLVDRLHDVTRDFPLTLDLGCNMGEIGVALSSEGGTRSGIERFVQCDFSPEMVKLADEEVKKTTGLVYPDMEITSLVCNEEYLPFPERQFDAVLSSCSLHWVNDLPGSFMQVQKVLKEDGLFLAAVIGGDTLVELRNSFIMADQERKGGIGLRVSPFAGHTDVGSLLNRAGFNLTTLDVDNIVIHYPNAFELMHDLSAMGESNASSMGIGHLSADTLAAAGSIYQQMYEEETEFGPAVPATFQVVYVIGWAPSDSQPKPLKRGSAQMSMVDIDEFLEKVKDAEIDDTRK